MTGQDAEQFNHQVDRMLAHRPTDTSEWDAEDLQLLEIARIAAGMDFSRIAPNRQALRSRLERRIFQAGLQRRKLAWPNWAGALLVFTLLFAFAANITPGRPRPTIPAPVLTSPLESAHPVAALNQPAQSNRPAEIPRPVPTPLAPVFSSSSMPTPAGQTPHAVP